MSTESDIHELSAAIRQQAGGIETAECLEELFLSDEYRFGRAQMDDEFVPASYFRGLKAVTYKPSDGLIPICLLLEPESEDQQKGLDKMNSDIENIPEKIQKAGDLLISLSEGKAEHAIQAKGLKTLGAIALRQNLTNENYFSEIIYPKAFIDVARFSLRSFSLKPEVKHINEQMSPETVKFVRQADHSLGEKLALELSRAYLRRSPPTKLFTYKG